MACHANLHFHLGLDFCLSYEKKPQFMSPTNVLFQPKGTTQKLFGKGECFRVLGKGRI